jgi:hypothetical protein
MEPIWWRVPVFNLIMFYHSRTWKVQHGRQGYGRSDIHACIKVTIYSHEQHNLDNGVLILGGHPTVWSETVRTCLQAIFPARLFVSMFHPQCLTFCGCARRFVPLQSRSTTGIIWQKKYSVLNIKNLICAHVQHLQNTPDCLPSHSPGSGYALQHTQPQQNGVAPEVFMLVGLPDEQKCMHLAQTLVKPCTSRPLQVIVFYQA